MTQITTDPSVDIRQEIAVRHGAGELADKLWFHKTAAAVIDADRCVRCGSCIAACPSASLTTAEDGMPTLVSMCTGCSRCWDLCPLAGMRTERLWKVLEATDFRPEGFGGLKAVYGARAKERAAGAQDGGVVSALLARLLDADVIGGALLTRRRNAFRSEPFVARTPEEVRQAAGSIYDQSLPLAMLREAGREPGERLAVVGTPCQINGVRALQRYGAPQRPNAASAVTLTVALFCTRSFDGLSLLRLLAERGVALGRVAKVAVQEAALRCLSEDGELLYEAPVREFRSAALRGCDECPDFSGRLADISVGSLGTPDGFTSVLVRTSAGERAWSAVADAFDIGDGCDLEAMERFADCNQRSAARTMRRGFDPDGPLWLSYSSHLASYAGTDRAPRRPPEFRSHHYRTSC